MGLAKIDVEVRADGPPTVTVNGTKVDGVVGFTVRHVPPSMPQLVLELAGEVTLEGEGIVALAPPEQGDEIAYLRSFLANLDPETLERQALDRITDHDTTGQAFVAALQAMVDQP